VLLDAALVDRPHPAQQLDPVVGDGHLQCAAILRVGSPSHAPRRLDAIDEAAHRGGAEHDLARELLDAERSAGTALERPQQVVPAEVGQAGVGEVRAHPAGDPGVRVEEGAPRSELIAVVPSHVEGVYMRLH
jgi:hypothetical protein